MLNTHEKTKRVWEIKAFNNDNNEVALPTTEFNDQVVEKVKELLYAGVATKITVTLQ